MRNLTVPLALVAIIHCRAAEPPLSFNRDIRPILSENCFQCHGPDSNRREAELRLDIREDALEAKAFLPGNVEHSELVRRVFEKNEDDRMPPIDSNRKLTERQKQLLKRWISEGAQYEPHWAYAPPTRTSPPVLQKGPKPENPIDAFILSALAREKLTPTPEADRRTLIRRLSLDLTGLPPEPKDVEAFVASRDPAACKKFVQQYLASPHFGERLALPWLDLVRFADTIGFHNDVPIRVWPYRDYVINAFNRNLPFDQFTREQLAGDLLPGSTIEQRVASGYNRIHRISGEGGIQDKEYFLKYAADRVRTTATVWMGSTLACAECHDHKFDPFTTKDFYRMSAIFADLKEKGAYNLSGGFTRENLTEETIFETPAQERRMKELDNEIARLTEKIKSRADDELAASRAAWERAILEADNECLLAWKVAEPIAVSSTAGTPFAIEPTDKSVVPGGTNPRFDTYDVTVVAGTSPITALRIESIQDVRFQGNDVARSGSMFFISEIELRGTRADGSPVDRVRIASAESKGATEAGHPVAAVADGDPATSLSYLRRFSGGIVLHLAEPFPGGAGATLGIRIRHSDEHPFQHLGRFRVTFHTLPRPDDYAETLPENVLKALRLPVDSRTPAQTAEIAKYYRTIAPELADLERQLLAATNARDYMIRALPSMPVSKSAARRPTRVLPRGNWMDDSGELVEPGVPGFMRQVEPAVGKTVSRLDFAEWLVAADNPLTARTFVNRLWRLYFGEGLTRTLEDLGSQGDWPTHPELLDWLAVEFRESGWNVKRMVELIVTSQAYRRSSQPSADLLERDPANRWLARQTPYRLDAELVRDNALAISGLLVRRLGGPSARPYQPEGYFNALNFPRREYVADVGEQLWRRGVYTHWQRTFLLPSFIAFDAPSRDECTANRSTSNTPLQALTLLNDPTYVEAARVFAENILRANGTRSDFRAKAGWAFVRALARPPTKQEATLLEALWKKQLVRYRQDEAAARELISTGDKAVAADLPIADLAAWTSVARAILNLHETITRN